MPQLRGRTLLQAAGAVALAAVANPADLQGFLPAITAPFLPL